MRRAVFYLFFDPQGRVDDFVLHTLGHLRKHAEHIFVVSNTRLDDVARERLESVADRVWVRENVGFDVWAYKEAMELTGPERLAEFDEIVLMNCTFFGPIGTFDDLFATMGADPDLDFWGITEHGDTEHHAFDKSKPMDAHLQSHWIAARRRLVTSPEWAEYWREMPMITSYEDSIIRHESRFTSHFVALGYAKACAFPAADYDSAHPIMDSPARMVADGCPIVKRRTFFHDPFYNEAHANDGRQVMRLMTERGYPIDLMLGNLARSSRPRDLITNLGLLEVLPEVEVSYDRAQPLRIVAVAHIYYPEMTEEILDRLDFLPDGYDLVVTTATEDRRDEIVAVLERRGRAGDVRIVESNRGRDISAFFLDCADVLEADYDLVVKLHSKKSPQDGHNIGELFKRHLFENLLSSPGYAANLVGLFQRYSSLGMVFPPMYHIGYPTVGHSWFGQQLYARDEAEFIGITVPMDDHSPVSAYGSMFVARPQLLRSISRAGYRHDDFPDDADYRDGALTHVLERLMSYAVLSTGHHIREVINADHAAINYNYLEYRAIALGSLLPGYARDQLKRLNQLKRFRRRTLKRGRFSPEAVQERRRERFAGPTLKTATKEKEKESRPKDERGRYLSPPTNGVTPGAVARPQPGAAADSAGHRNRPGSGGVSWRPTS